MICRVAEACFWLHRYVERMDNTARLLEIHRESMLDSRTPPAQRWRPLLIVSGEAPHFDELYGPDAAADGERVERYLTWVRDNPASVHTSAFWARENARSVREVLSREAWECLNAFWIWLTEGEGEQLWRQRRREFHGRVRESAQLFHGVVADSVLHDQAYDFMRLGVLLERANFTARILDLHHHRLAATPDALTPAQAMLSAHAILATCSGIEAFLKRRSPFQPTSVALFLTRDREFPRAIGHCLAEAEVVLARLARHCVARTDLRSPAALGRLARDVAALDVGGFSQQGAHEVHTDVVDRVAEICDLLAKDFFDPPFPGATAAGSPGAPAQ